MARWLPIFAWLPGYRREDLPGDLIAGIVVAIMLVPQGMAYALLAGLPPQVGLYASVVPVLIYALFGTSRSMAVGPVAIASLMTAAATADMAAAGHGNALSIALVLAALSGGMMLLLGVARLGFVVNFLSHPVISGFTSAAAILIAVGQLKPLLGIDYPRGTSFIEAVWETVRQVPDIHLATAAIGAAAIAILLLSRKPMGRALARAGLPRGWVDALTKTGPLLVVVLGTVAVWVLGLSGGKGAVEGVKVVGAIPAGLPPLKLPPLDGALWRDALPAAALIALVGYLESVSVATALASRRRERIDASQELIALGAANLGASVTGAYPVAGGFGRSMVNFTAGARTPLASILTALLVAATILALTPLLFFLPRAVLAAIIVVAVAQLIDLRTPRIAWRYNKPDALAHAATFVAVLAIGVELGIVVGVGLSLLLHLYRTSRPHMAVVGQVGDTEHFRNVERHKVRTIDSLLIVRVDESLYFANTRYLEERVLKLLAERPAVVNLVLVCSAVNEIDTSALEMLEDLADRLHEAGTVLHLAEVKGPVMDRLKRTDFLDHLTPGRVFLSTYDAFRDLGNDNARTA